MRNNRISRQTGLKAASVVIDRLAHHLADLPMTAFDIQIIFRKRFSNHRTECNMDLLRATHEAAPSTHKCLLFFV